MGRENRRNEQFRLLRNYFIVFHYITSKHLNKSFKISKINTNKIQNNMQLSLQSQNVVKINKIINKTENH